MRYGKYLLFWKYKRGKGIKMQFKLYVSFVEETESFLGPHNIVSSPKSSRHAKKQHLKNLLTSKDLFIGNASTLWNNISNLLFHALWVFHISWKRVHIKIFLHLLKAEVSILSLGHRLYCILRNVIYPVWIRSKWENLWILFFYLPETPDQFIFFCTQAVELAVGRCKQDMTGMAPISGGMAWHPGR